MKITVEKITPHGSPPDWFDGDDISVLKTVKAALEAAEKGVNR